MKSQTDIELILERLGNDWRADSLADGVVRRIESDRIRPELKRGRWPGLRPLLAIAASLAAATTLWWTLRSDNSLYAQALDSIRRAHTLQMIATVQPDPGKPPQRAMESWYERGVGFREEVGAEVHLGNKKNFWTYVKDSKLAIRSNSHGVDDIVARILDNEALQVLKDAHIERYPAGDQMVDGQPCQAYLPTKLERFADRDLKAGKKRMVILLGDRSRITQVRIEARSGDRWVVQFISNWKYDAPVDRALFEPHFSGDVKIVDADAVFDDFVNLENAVHREERAGLWYAIHRAERFENGGILLVSSVRGTEETLKNYPLTRRPFRPGLFFVDGPARNCQGSSQGDGYFAIELASADHQGIDVRWWVLVPRGTPPTYFDVGSGKVKLPVGITPEGEFAKANFADKNGVLHHLTWDIVLEIPQAKSLPTLDSISGEVYAEVERLQVVPFRWLNMGPKGGTSQLSDPSKCTAAEFSKAVADHIRWWLANDVEFQLEGQFATPKVPGTYVPQHDAADNPAMGLMYNPVVDDSTLARVAKHGSLKRLYLDGTKITDAGLRQITGLKELHSLGLADTSISDAGLKELEALSALKTLNVRNTKVTPNGVARLKAAIPKLQIKH